MTDTGVNRSGDGRRLPDDGRSIDVLARRARQLAAPTATATATATARYLRVRLGGQSWFGIPQMATHAVVAAGKIAEVPGVPAHIVGVISLRGEMVTVLDLPLWFGIGQLPREPAAQTPEAEAILLVEGGGMTVGMLVQELGGEFACASASLAMPPAGAVVDASYVTGIYEASVTVLNIEAILSDPRLLVNT